MSIIEKLGITPGPWISYDGIVRNDKDEHHICTIIDQNTNDSNLILTAPEMLEALIVQTHFFEVQRGHMPHIFADDDRYRQNVKIIEKATGKSWMEIKELI